jgi:hypothetical protein
MKKSRGFSYPMPLEDAEELARELSEFGYRETDDPDEADRRRFYKVERWDAGEQHVIETRPRQQHRDGNAGRRPSSTANRPPLLRQPLIRPTYPKMSVPSRDPRRRPGRER